ncbi:DUF4959 domain-containing protein [Labilibacter sediminis]|nr:DUF4959 domain-containing protein [Labilibacter sediminis]
MVIMLRNLKTGKMEKLRLTKIMAFIGIVSTILVSCSKDDDNNLDSTPPGPVSNVQIEPTHGGAKITYDLPGDKDVMYVKASYVNTLGQKMFKVTSFYDNEIILDGYNDVEEHNVKIEVFDRSNNVSEPINKKFTPLVSHIELAKENMVVTPDFGGVRLVWENVTGDPMYTFLTYESQGEDVRRIIASSHEDGKKVERSMDTLKKEFFVQLEDFYGNKTERVSKGEHSPWFEEEIDKTIWDLVPSLSVDGNIYEGKTENIWDGIVDTKDSNDDNSYALIHRSNNGGQLNFPLDVVIDLNAMVVINRFVVWQRAFWWGNDGEYFYYQNENFKSFNLYASNDKVEWSLIGEFDLGDPKDADGNVPLDILKEAANGHEFELDEYPEPFRYLKLSITGNFGSEEMTAFSEITLFGKHEDLN